MLNFRKKQLALKKTTLPLLLSLAILTLLLVGILSMLKPIPQPQSYHHFADQRSWLGIPNAWNVLSNIPFALAGIWGLFLLLFTEKVNFIDDRERWFWSGVSIGLILTALGSGYYHLVPNDSRLLWDRLAMTTIFMSISAALIGERINVNLGFSLWPVLLVVGLYSVFFWHHNDDLRFYLAVQVFTGLVILLMLFSPSNYDRSKDLAVVFLFYVLAFLFEQLDHEVYRFSKGTISGHTLKHLAGALAGAWLILMIWKRKIGEGK